MPLCTKVRTLFTTLGYIAAGKTPEARSSILVELGTFSGLVHPQHKPDAISLLGSC